MNILKDIRILRIVAFFLFLLPAIGLLGSLLIHNYLVSFNYTKNYDYNFKKNEPGESVSIICNKNNEYCKSESFYFRKNEKLNNCYNNRIIAYFANEDGDKIEIIDLEEFKNKIKNSNENIYAKYTISSELDKECILNSNSLFLYNLFPFFFENFHKLKRNKNTQLGTSKAVNPFIKGETSISNIVKRFPLKFFFKPVLYLTVIFMIIYWRYFNLIIKKFTDHKKNYFFFYFGILSALFLFLHIFFLGWTFENEFLTKLRRSYVVIFIFFEILSQAFLIKKILLIKDKFRNYFNFFVIYLKLAFVIFACSSTLVILIILLFYNLPPNIDYILEWNYFLILLIFYFLSYLMWKKNNN